MSLQTDDPAPSRTASLTQEFVRIQGELKGFLVSRLGSQAEADDVLQAAFLRALSSTQSGTTPHDARAWLFQIARHIVIDTGRRERSQRRLKDGLLEHTSDVAFDEALSRDVGESLAALLPSLIDDLPEIYAQALNEVELGGSTQVEAARKLGVSVAAMKSRVRRGRELLHGALRRCCQFDLDARGKVIACHSKSGRRCSVCDD